MGIGVADVGFEADFGGDGIDGSGENLADADGGDGVDGAGGFGGGLEGEDEFGGGGEGVVSAGHEEGSGVSAFALDINFEGGGGGDVGDDADVDGFAFEDWALLDVEFYEGGVVTFGEGYGVQIALEVGGVAEVGEGGAVWVAEIEGLGGGESGAEEAAAEASDAEAGGFLGGEEDEFNGASGLEAGALEGADGFEGAEDADGAVVGSGVGDGVDVGAGGDWGEIGVGLVGLPAGEGVADGVFAEGETGGAA